MLFNDLVENNLKNKQIRYLINKINKIQ